MRIFVTFILPQNEVAARGLSFAAANFSRALVCGRCFDKTYSVLPTSEYGPLNITQDEEYEVIYSSLRTRRPLRYLAVIYEQIKIFTKIRKNDSVWLYNLNFLTGILYILLGVFKPSVKRNVILLDFTPATSIFQQNYWWIKLLNKADSSIVLSPNINLKCKKISCLPGVVPYHNEIYPEINEFNNHFLLSGTITNSISLTNQVLQAFSELPHCVLHITGNILSDYEQIRDYASKFKNIIYYERQNYDDYIRLLHSVTYVLSTRDPHAPENMHNFPSKIIEGLLHNRVVISTIQYPQLKGLYLKTVRHDHLKEDIESFVSDENVVLEFYANQSIKVKQLYNPKIWGNVMSNLENTMS